MNVRTITRFAIAIPLVFPAAAAFAGEDFPYTGPNEPVMTTAANDAVTRHGRDSVYVEQGTGASQRSSAGNEEASNVAVMPSGRDSVYVREGSNASRRSTAEQARVLEAIQDVPVTTHVYGRG